MLALYFDREIALMFCNGTNAIRAAIFAINIDKGSRIAVSGYNYPPVALAVASMGYEPFLMDVSGNTLSSGIDDVIDAIAHDVAAVLLTSMWGYCDSWNEVYDHCSRHGISLIIDASRAYGAATASGVPISKCGDIVIFSMNSSKAFGVGEGGFLLTDDPKVGARATQIGLPLHPKAGVTRIGFELGFGEKAEPHPSAVKLAISELSNLFKYIKSSRANAEKAKLTSNIDAWVEGNGLRGGWKDIAFWGIDNLPLKVCGRVRNEFQTNTITSWAPENWGRITKPYKGIKAVRNLMVVENGASYGRKFD